MSELRPADIFAALSDTRVDYVTIGGMAMIAHGVVRATIDVDIVPSPDAENRERLVAALGMLGAQPAGEPDAAITHELLDREANMRFDTVAGQVDVLSAAQYRRLYPDLRARALEVEVDGVPIVVASRNDLIRLKAATGRDRDLLDIGDLLALDEQ